MLFLTALTAGLCAAMLRSALSLALVGVLIVATFAIAALAGPVSFLSLTIALAGYNLGIFCLVACALLADRRSATA